MNLKERTAETAERAHHPYSASKLQYVEACPFYDSAESTSEASEAGTRQHAATESGTAEGLESDEEAENVTKVLDYLDAVRQELSETWGKFEELNEIYVGVDKKAIKDETGHVWKGTSGGFLDKAFISADRKHARVIDYKFGKWKVEDTSNNVQGFVYAVGLLRKFPSLEDIRVEFAMPALDLIDSEIFTAAQLEEKYLRILTIVERAIAARRGAIKIEPSPAQGLCVFCANKASCKPLQEMALQIGKKFAPLKIPEDLRLDHINDPREAQLGIQLADVVKGWAESFRRAATEKAIESDDFVPEGYELKHVTNREIVDIPAMRKLAATVGITTEEFDAMLKLGIGDIDKAISAKSARGQKRAAIAKFDEVARAAGVVADGDTKTFLAMKRNVAEED